MTERYTRSFVKAVTWRFFGSMDTLVLSWLITGQFKIAVTIMSVEFMTKIFLYWTHERIWLKIPYGKITVDPTSQQGS